MSYSLYITRIGGRKILYCGQLYRHEYNPNPDELLSYKWMIENEYMNGNECFIARPQFNIVLYGHELIEFLTAYIKDIEEHLNFATQEMKRYLEDIVKKGYSYNKYLLEWI